MIKIQNLASFIYILANAFDPKERIASNFSLEYHKNKGNDHYVKRLKVVTQIHLVSTLGNVKTNNNLEYLYIYSYFNLRCRIKASRVRDKTERWYG